MSFNPHIPPLSLSFHPNTGSVNWPSIALGNKDKEKAEEKMKKAKKKCINGDEHHFKIEYIWKIFSWCVSSTLFISYSSISLSLVFLRGENNKKNWKVWYCFALQDGRLPLDVVSDNNGERERESGASVYNSTTIFACLFNKKNFFFSSSLSWCIIITNASIDGIRRVGEECELGGTS